MSLKERDTVDFPLSFWVKGNASARSGFVGEAMRRKAWCGFLPLPCSVVVRRTLRVEAEVKASGFATGFWGVKLWKMSWFLHWMD